MSDHPVRDLVAQADRQRRFRAAAAQLRRLAPIAAGISLGVGLAGRFVFGWPAWIGVAALAVGAVTLGVFAYLQRRPHATTDTMASAVDVDAGLNGELRSAHWFEGQGGRDAWADFHIDHATTRSRAVDWAGLYPADRSARPWVVTAVLSLAVVAFAIRMPARVPAEQVETSDAGVAAEMAALPKDLQAKLAALLAQLDQAAASKDPVAKAASLADLKDLMAKLDPAMQKKLAEMLEKKTLDKDTAAASAQNGKPDAAENATAGLPEDVKWALENQAARMGEAAADDKKSAEKNAAASGKSGEQSSGAPQTQQKGDAAAESTSPLMREAASEQQGNKVMMGGGGPMGGDSRPGAGAGNEATKGAAEALLVAQALKKEMVEANADALGENVDKEDLRRKTEQGKSGLGFTRAAAPRVEPSRATAPPPVPEARRPLLFSYFIRR